MENDNIVFFKKFISDEKDKKYESLQQSVENFVKITLPPRGAVDKIYKNWEDIIKNENLEKDVYEYIAKYSYPSHIVKKKNGEATLHIAVKNSEISNYFKINQNQILDNINFLFKKVVINKIIVKRY